MTRLTNGYSKRLRNHRAAVALHVAFYNLCRVHKTLRITPAMAVSVTDHGWTIGELIQKALDCSGRTGADSTAAASSTALPRRRVAGRSQAVQAQGGKVGGRHQNRNRRKPGA